MLRRETCPGDLAVQRKHVAHQLDGLHVHQGLGQGEIGVTVYVDPAAFCTVLLAAILQSVASLLVEPASKAGQPPIVPEISFFFRFTTLDWLENEVLRKKRSNESTNKKLKKSAVCFSRFTLPMR